MFFIKRKCLIKEIRKRAIKTAKRAGSWLLFYWYQPVIKIIVLMLPNSDFLEGTWLMALLAIFEHR